MTPTLPSATAAPKRTFVAGDLQAGNRQPAGPAPKAQPVSNPRLTVFQYVAALYLFLYFSRLIEFMPGVRPIVVFSIILLAGALMSGRILALFGTTTGRLMAAFLLWNWVCAVFSVWIGGSISLCFDVSKLVLSVLIVVAYMNSLRAALLLLIASGLGFGSAAIFPSFSAEVVVGRTAVGAGGGSGTLSDPNFFCLFLLTGLPLLWHATRLLPLAAKLIPIGLSVLTAVVAFKTGSRGGMISIVVGMIYFLIQATGKQRAKVLAGIGFAVILAVLFAPRNLLLRFTTMVEVDQSRITSEEDVQETARASGSASTRLRLLKRAIELTLRNPIFGVGPGMFQVAESQTAEGEGEERGIWLDTHNVFTECSSNTGLIGFGLFLGTVITGFRSLTRIRAWSRINYHPLGEMMYNAAFYLQIALVIMFSAGFFLNILYMSTWWLLIGLAIGLSLACHYEIVTYEAQRVGRAPVLQRT